MRLITIKTQDNEKLEQRYVEFTSPGGTIGQDADNTLVLPDSTNTISPLHATIEMASSGEAFVKAKEKTLPLILNDKTLPHDVAHPLAEGDILSIGGYQFSVNFHDIATSIDSTATETPLSVQPISTNGINDAIWDELEAEFPPDSRHQEALNIDDPTHPLFIPDNETEKQDESDPLAMLEEASLPPLYDKAAVPNSLFENENDEFSQLTIMNDTTPSVLTAPASFHQVQADEAEKTSEEILSLDWPLESENHNREEDDSSSLADLFSHNAVPLTSEIDSLTALETDPLPEATPIQQSNITHKSPSTEHQLFAKESMEDTVEKSQDDVLHDNALANVSYIQKQDNTAASSQDECINAFITGLGLDDVATTTLLTTEQCYQAGKLLRLFTQSTITQLSSSNRFKQDIKANSDVFSSQEHNLFEHLPSGEAALMQIFTTSAMPGFMTPENSLHTSINDLTSHQLGMIAGLKATMTSMLENFSPELLEKQAKAQLAGNVFFRSKKAMQWDILKSQHQKMRDEVEETLFGRAFRQAYENEITQFKKQHK